MTDLNMVPSEQTEHMLSRYTLPIAQFNIENTAQIVLRVQALSQGGWDAGKDEKKGKNAEHSLLWPKKFIAFFIKMC